MKTVVDAVNDFRGVWIGGSDTSTLWLLDDSAPMQYGDTITDRTVCTRDEFEQCVAEMTEGLFVPLSDLNKRKASGECEQETVELDGMVYEVGKVYEFQRGGYEIWHSATLEAVRFHEEKQFETTDDYFLNIRECQSQLGTITKAPLVLEDGRYEFTLYGEEFMGYYRKDRKSFMDKFIGGNKICGEAEAANITKLVPEQK